MNQIKFEFANAQGDRLAGLLQLPANGFPVRAYALFAHCFTCGKDIAAASRIARALAARGIAVLRFDFTGLGGSDGDFANSGFSSNVDDLLCAAAALGERYAAPRLLIGHSLGGAAVLAAAPRLDSVDAVVTIGAPATASHVRQLFSERADEIRERGEAAVDLAGREFTIRREFLDDLERYTSTVALADLGAALLVFHSPADTIVSIDEAAKIYQAARHPKSFVSLDRADHLLSRPADAEYVADTLAAWAGRYLGAATAGDGADAPRLDPGEVLISELDRKFLRGMHAGRHWLRADEPEDYGGSDLGPTPYDLLLMALGACTSMTLRMYANRKRLPLDDVDVRLVHERVHAEDCVDCEHRIERITRRIRLVGELDDAERQSLLAIADRCPVHRTLESHPRIETELVD